MPASPSACRPYLVLRCIEQGRVCPTPQPLQHRAHCHTLPACIQDLRQDMPGTERRHTSQECSPVAPVHAPGLLSAPPSSHTSALPCAHACEGGGPVRHSPAHTSLSPQSPRILPSPALGHARPAPPCTAQHRCMCACGLPSTPRGHGTAHAGPGRQRHAHSTATAHRTAQPQVLDARLRRALSPTIIPLRMHRFSSDHRS